MGDSRPAWAALTAITFTLVSTTAHAQEDYKSKTWLRLEAAATTDFGLNLNVEVPASAATSVSLGSRGNLRVGLEAPMGLAVLLRLGVRSVSTSTTFQGGVPEQDGSGTLWALGLEGRYYPMNRKRTQAFGFLELSKSWAVLSQKAGVNPVDQHTLNLVGDRMSPFGLAFGVGAEHGFTHEFLVGAKWGLDLEFVGIEDRAAQAKSSGTQVGTSAEIYLAYRF